jgi:hypothetical protein
MVCRPPGSNPPFPATWIALRLGLFVLHTAWLPTDLLTYSRRLQLPMPLGMGLQVTPGEHFLGVMQPTARFRPKL